MRPRERNFNPHSRKGSDGGPHKTVLPLFFISIHTPARGVTYELKSLEYTHIDFNPHSRKGSDKGQNTLREAGEISIHTPARGVT